MTQPMQLLRTDQKGRVRTPRERREAFLEEYEGSGASGAAFAKRCGVKYQTLMGWVQQRKRAGARLPAVPLVEVTVAAAAVVRTGVPVVVQLAGGAQVELSASGQVPLVAALVRALTVEGGLC
jgi:transposase-like protein